MSGGVLHKFGGSSLATANCFKQVVSIVLDDAKKRKSVAVVVSAMGGKPKVTDMLLSTVKYALEGNKQVVDGVLNDIRKRHFDVIHELLPQSAWEPLETSINEDLDDIGHILKATAIMKVASTRVTGIVSGHGELWSAQILAALLSQAESDGGAGMPYHFLDARKALVVVEDQTGCEVLWEESLAKLDSQMSDGGAKWQHMVITGFIASTKEGVMTTLMRDGSDFSASIFGNLLEVQSVTIWTDVSGVLSADPRRVKNARYVSHLSYNEAMELSYFGAKVIHPSTMRPAVDKSIPIFIRNTFEPAHVGTCISIVSDPNAVSPPEPPSGDGEQSSGSIRRSASGLLRDKSQIFKGLTSVDSLALFNVEGMGMMGVPGIATRLFAALHKEQVNVIFIAQASSEHSICFAIPYQQAQLAKASVEEAFFKELHYRHIQPIGFIAPVSVIAMVGDNMTNTVGVSGLLFSALGKAKVNVLAISQGSSQRNISAVVSESDAQAALQAIHDKMLKSEDEAGTMDIENADPPPVEE